jgi:hypothetical protein
MLNADTPFNRVTCTRQRLREPLGQIDRGVCESELLASGETKLLVEGTEKVSGRACDPWKITFWTNFSARSSRGPYISTRSGEGAGSSHPVDVEALTTKARKKRSGRLHPISLPTLAKGRTTACLGHLRFGFASVENDNARFLGTCVLWQNYVRVKSFVS